MKTRIVAALFLLVGVTSLHAYDREGAARDQEAARLFGQNIPLEQWLGPLAPIALSPFFGLACLSGASLLIERGLLPDHPALSGNPALNHEAVFAVLLALALFTSLPRLTKVSKPLAQLGDFLETYAGIVLIVVVQYFGMRAAESMAGGSAYLSAGLADSSGMILIAVISAINIIVIQTVRFFFELLIFLSPIPLLDAIFETINKLICAALVAVYVFSPYAAMLINVALFLLCLMVFRFARRRIALFREKILRPMWQRIRSRRPA